MHFRQATVLFENLECLQFAYQLVGWSGLARSTYPRTGAVFPLAQNLRFPPMLLKNSMLQCGKF